MVKNINSNTKPKTENTQKKSAEAKQAKKVDNTTTSIKKLSEIYNKDYFENGIATKKSDYTNYSWIRLGQYFNKTAKHITDKFNPKTALDVGCAKGFLVKALVDLGIDAYGIDPSEYAVAEAPPDVKDKLTLGVAQSLPYPDNKFDVVTCFDVLEHIPETDVPKVLSEMLRVTKDWLVLRLVTREIDDDVDASHKTLHGKDWWHERIEKAGGMVQPVDSYYNGGVWWFNVKEFLIVVRKK